MRKYPNIFHPEFVEWWEKVEDATARGEKPPPKPKEYFMPNPYATVEDPTGEINELKENELRAKEDELKGNKKKSKFSNKPKTGFQ